MLHLHALRGRGEPIGMRMLLEMLMGLTGEDAAVGDEPPADAPYWTESQDPNRAFTGEPLSGPAPIAARSPRPDRGTQPIRIRFGSLSGDPREADAMPESTGRAPRGASRPTGPGLADALDRRVPADEPAALRTQPGTARKRARSMFKRGTPLLEALRRLGEDPVTRGAIPEGEVKVHQTIARQR